MHKVLLDYIRRAGVTTVLHDVDNTYTTKTYDQKQFCAFFFYN